MRRLLPKKRQESQELQVVDGGRRKRHQVSRACDTCRKRKVKCDARRPACSPCVLAGVSCRFSIPEGNETAQKNALQVRLREMSQTDTHLKAILNLLHQTSHDESSQLLSKIREAPTINDFVETFSQASLLLPPHRYKASPPSQSVNIAALSPYPGSRSLSPSLEPLNIPDELVSRFPYGVLPITYWTSLSVDNKYLTHLLNLFFTWDNTLSHTIPRSRFIQDLSSCAATETTYCSRFLVHALLAVSHLYAIQGALPARARDLRLRGRPFADEALRILQDEKPEASIPLAQGLAMLWVYEINYGRRSRGMKLLDQFYLVHDALSITDLEMDRMDGNGASTDWQVLSFVIWGLFCFESKVSIVLTRPMRTRKPKICKAFADSHSSIFTYPESAEYSWSPYPGPSQSQLSSFREVFVAECQIAEFILEASRHFALSVPGTPFPNYSEAKDVFERVLKWNMGGAQRFLINRKLLPSMLFLDITHETVLLKLLSCFCRFPSHHIDGETSEAARASYGASIISNLWMYRAAYGPRHEYWLLQALLVAATAVVLKLPESPGLGKSVIMACQLLFEMGDFLPVANECLWSIKELASQRGAKLPQPCRILFAALAVRAGKIYVKDVGLVQLEVGAAENLSPTSTQEVTFSGLIEGIRAQGQRGGVTASRHFIRASSFVPRQVAPNSRVWDPKLAKKSGEMTSRWSLPHDAPSSQRISASGETRGNLIKVEEIAVSWTPELSPNGPESRYLKPEPAMSSTQSLSPSQSAIAATVQPCSTFDFTFSNPFQTESPYTPRERVLPRIRDNQPLFVDHGSDRTLTYSQLREDSLTLAAGLHRLGLDPKDVQTLPPTPTCPRPEIAPVVLIQLPNSLQFATCLMGVLASGLTATLVSPALTAKEIAWVVQCSRPRVIITATAFLPAMQQALKDQEDAAYSNQVRVFSVNLATDRYPQLPTQNADPEHGDWTRLLIPASRPGSLPQPFPPAAALTRTAIILWSSGTSGRSKGVLLSHHALNFSAASLWHDYDAYRGQPQRWLGYVPFFHVFGLSNVFLLAIATGAVVYSMPAFKLDVLLDGIRDRRPTFLQMAPPIAVMLAKSPLVEPYAQRDSSGRNAFSSIVAGVTGGAPLGHDIVVQVFYRLGFLVRMGYGLSEACSVTLQHGVGEADMLSYQNDTGRPHWGVELLVAAEDNDWKPGHDTLAAPVGASGEILIRSPALMSAYLPSQGLAYSGIPDMGATTEALTPDGWFRTGDVGHINDSGSLSITDRIKELIKVRAFQVAPAELEALLCSSEAVADAGVVGVMDKSEATEWPRAFVVAAGQHPKTTEQLHELAQELKGLVEKHTARYKWLVGGIVFVQQIPKSPSGKILRRVMRDGGVSGVEVALYKRKNRNGNGKL